MYATSPFPPASFVVLIAGLNLEPELSKIVTVAVASRIRQVCTMEEKAVGTVMVDSGLVGLPIERNHVIKHGEA